MKIYYRRVKDTADTILNYEHLSADEFIKQAAQCLHDDQTISSLRIENVELYEHGANALRHAILGHKSLRKLTLKNICICSYSACSDDEYYFPKDLDNTVEQLCALLRDGRLTEIELNELNFRDRTEHRYEHFDMVDPATMRDILLQEKAPFYAKKLIESLLHNPHLYRLTFSIIDMDVSHAVNEIEMNIKRRHSAEQINAMLQGTYAASESVIMPEIYKFFTTWVWMNNWFQKRKR
jgi:hypothetical protein